MASSFCQICGRKNKTTKVENKHGSISNYRSGCIFCNPHNPDKSKNDLIRSKSWCSQMTNKNPEEVEIIYECKCKNVKKVYHHFDYSFTYYVFLLCYKCHRREHSKIKKLNEFYKEKLGINIDFANFTRFLFNFSFDQLIFKEQVNGIEEVCKFFNIENHDEFNCSFAEVIREKINKIKLEKLKKEVDEIKHRISMPETEDELKFLIKSLKPFSRNRWWK